MYRVYIVIRFIVCLWLCVSFLRLYHSVFPQAPMRHLWVNFLFCIRICGTMYVAAQVHIFASMIHHFLIHRVGKTGPCVVAMMLLSGSIVLRHVSNMVHLSAHLWSLLCCFTGSMAYQPALMAGVVAFAAPTQHRMGIDCALWCIIRSLCHCVAHLLLIL